MTIGIVGTGRMGRALAGVISARVEPVFLAGVRADRAEPPRWPDTADLDDVWRHCRLVLLALPFPVAATLMAGEAGRLGRGRTLVDVSNPGLTPDTAPPPGRSAGELIARAARTWSVVKAFNTISADLIGTPRMHGRPVTVPVAGDETGKREVYALASTLGFEPLDAGGITASRELESLAVLLVRVSAAQNLHGRIAIQIGQPAPVGRL